MLGVVFGVPSNLEVVFPGFCLCVCLPLLSLSCLFFAA